MKYFLAAMPLAALGLAAALAPAPTATITVRNALGRARRAETISLPLARLPAAVRRLAPASLRVHATQGHALLVSQLLDTNGDGQPDELLFQTDVPARGTQTFTLAATGSAFPGISRHINYWLPAPSAHCLS